VDETILIDWRYFKVENGVGSATCGLARRSLAAYLKSVSNHTDFLTATWLDRLSTSGRNASMLGFLVEQTVISSLVVMGCPIPAVQQDFKEVKRGWTEESFAGQAPVISKRRGTTIYVPMEYNHKAADAIMVHQSSAGNVGKPKAIVMGIQITIAQNHTKSELNFFENWDDSCYHRLSFVSYILSCFMTYVRRVVVKNSVSQTVGTEHFGRSVSSRGKGTGRL
jgi:hypothetical protein